MEKIKKNDIIFNIMSKLNFIFKKQFWFFIILCFLLLSLIFIVWVIRLDIEIVNKFSKKTFISPTEYYAYPRTFNIQQEIQPNKIIQKLNFNNFRQRTINQTIHPGDFSLWTPEFCQKILQDKHHEQTSICLAWRNKKRKVKKYNIPIQVIAFDSNNKILKIFNEDQFEETNYASLDAELFAQFLGKNPIFQKWASLGEIPTYCLNAVIAIEDDRFLQHSGISIKSIARAFYKNLKSRQLVEGGSTITQQLVKNYFLSPEKTLERKLNELIMSLIVEYRIKKDEILETYLNIIYWGQNGPYQIRGIKAAAKHYFNKDLNLLSLGECTLLAGIIKSPGHYNPFKNPDLSLKRRSLVIKRMKELKLITPKLAKITQQTPLPTEQKKIASETAPYFIQAVQNQIHQLKIKQIHGLKVYTTLNLHAQMLAQNAVQNILKNLDDFKKNKEKNKEKEKELNQKQPDLKINKNPLQGILISANISNGHIQAIIGGNNYLESQFNRGLHSKRQIGSIIKPWIYLNALDNNKNKYTPITMILDEEFTHKYQGQQWSPKNYNHKYYQYIPLYFALKNSLNAASARLALDLGLNEILNTIKKLGVKSKIAPLPSLALGAIELHAWEVLQAYLTIARQGEYIPITYIDYIFDQKNNLIYQHQKISEKLFSKIATAELISILKQTVLNGTAKSLSKSGFDYIAAGKTGTTSDYKDAWFVGFTPFHIALTWVGYDDNTSHNFSGASGALPIWASYMNEYNEKYPNQDFDWPKSTKKITFWEDTNGKIILDKETLNINNFNSTQQNLDNNNNNNNTNQKNDNINKIDLIVNKDLIFKIQ